MFLSTILRLPKNFEPADPIFSFIIALICPLFKRFVLFYLETRSGSGLIDDHSYLPLNACVEIRPQHFVMGSHFTGAARLSKNLWPKIR